MTISITKSARFLSTALMLLIYSSSLAFPSVLAFGERFQELSAGATVRVALPQISSMNAMPGQIINGTCPSGVIIKGVKYVNPGAPVKVRVASAVAPKSLGKPGSLALEVVSVTAVDGTEVPLTGGSMSAMGEDKNTKSLVLGLFICILFLFQKGGEASFPAGTTVDAFVANSVDIEVD